MIRRRLPAALLGLLTLALPACGGDAVPKSLQVSYSPRPGQLDSSVALPGVATPKPLDGRARIDIRIQDGVLQTGVSEVLVREGTRVTFSVSSDYSDKLIVEKYDSFDVKKNQIVQVGMNAVLTGLFSVDLEKTGVHVLNLHVVS